MKRQSRREKPAADQRNTRDDWVRAGLSTLARNGIEAVRVEPLAERLRVTKGSFYWHFKDRAALHAAMLETWRAVTTREIIERLNVEGLPPRARLQRLIELTTSGAKVAHLETAIRSWARNDSSVAATVAVVDDERLAYVAGLLVEIGIDLDLAARRATALYLMLIGSFFAANSRRLQAGPELWREVTQLIERDAT